MTVVASGTAVAAPAAVARDTEKAAVTSWLVWPAVVEPSAAAVVVPEDVFDCEPESECVDG
jgi:hypothetical protein